MKERGRGNRTETSCFRQGIHEKWPSRMTTAERRNDSDVVLETQDRSWENSREEPQHNNHQKKLH